MAQLPDEGESRRGLKAVHTSFCFADDMDLSIIEVDGCY
jgi:hypothetical protein